METYRSEPAGGGPELRVSEFAVEGGARELHLSVTPSAPGTFDAQLQACERVYRDALESFDLPATSAVFRRFFLSDAANQEAVLARSCLARADPANPVAVSVVEQAPLREGRVALWAYHIDDPGHELVKEAGEAGLLVRRERLSHLWTSELGVEPGTNGDPRAQTRAAFGAYARVLRGQGACLRDDVIRTWVFLESVDLDYAAMSDERREFFAGEGLTHETHYIASTGIAGRRADPARRILLEGYAIPGIREAQLRLLDAPERLGRTDSYGVTFERGVRVDHGDRVHVLISGTASIDPRGSVRHPRDIARQTERTFGNVEALLAEAGAGPGDIAQMIVYLRDPGDRATVARYVDERFPATPALLVHAPVCRPEWLIEVEAQAIARGGDARWGRL